jgi:hypothetical protein
MQTSVGLSARINRRYAASARSGTNENHPPIPYSFHFRRLDAAKARQSFTRDSAQTRIRLSKMAKQDRRQVKPKKSAP